ncbi:MAG: GNAT family N-acetyltransferase, partial [Anaerolineales bacterium]
MQIEAYNDADAFAERAAEWRALTARSLARTPFQTNEFQRVWWSHFGSGDLCLLAARADDGALVGLVNMFVDPDGVLRWVGGEEIADYLDVIAAPSELESVRMAVFEWLAGPHAPDWKRAQLSNIPEWTGTPEHWRALAAERGWAAAVSELDVCPVVPLPATFEEYLAQIDSKQRREIRRKRRRAEGSEDDVSWRIAAPGDDIAADTET